MDAGLTPYSIWWIGLKRRVSSLAYSAYLASAACTLELQSAILTKCTTVPYAYFEEVLAARHDTLPAVIDPLPVKQGEWDRSSDKRAASSANKRIGQA